uniref:Uncharacterized protein n=1 Tax=Aegilops tauschii subsp. strangulata TaxID=200361 RepID=A0A453FSG4_AEGTS
HDRKVHLAGATRTFPLPGVVTAAAEERSVVGEVVARMDIEVNDYPGSSANGRHEPPRSPGRG